jgi:hypothetical protein
VASGEGIRNDGDCGNLTERNITRPTRFASRFVDEGKHLSDLQLHIARLPYQIRADYYAALPRSSTKIAFKTRFYSKSLRRKPWRRRGFVEPMRA